MVAGRGRRRSLGNGELRSVGLRIVDMVCEAKCYSWWLKLNSSPNRLQLSFSLNWARRGSDEPRAGVAENQEFPRRLTRTREADRARIKRRPIPSTPSRLRRDRQLNEKLLTKSTTTSVSAGDNALLRAGTGYT
jgi:hypothetical protein